MDFYLDIDVRNSPVQQLIKSRNVDLILVFDEQVGYSKYKKADMELRDPVPPVTPISMVTPPAADPAISSGMSAEKIRKCWLMLIEEFKKCLPERIVVYLSEQKGRVSR